MKIYTKTGDQGTTRLYTNQEINKDSLRVEAYGTIDELNVHLSYAKNLLKDTESKEFITLIQRKLFNVAGELATVDRDFPEPILEEDVTFLEERIDYYVEQMNKTQENLFIIPGSNQISAYLHVCRTVCRRAERRIISLKRSESVSPTLLKYVNRLSDMIYSIARSKESELDYVRFKNKE